MAARAGRCPAISTSRIGSRPHASTTGTSDGRPVRFPNIGSYVSWSMIRWRVWLRRWRSLLTAASLKNTWPTTLSESAVPWGLEVTRQVDLAGRAGRDVGQDDDAAAEDDRRRLEDHRGVVPDRPGDDAVDELEIGVDQRHIGRGLGADGPQRPEPDGEVADLRGVALDDVEGRALAAEEVAVDRGREQRATRQRDLVRAARRREDAEVDLGRAFRRVGRAADDRDLVDDDVAAAQGRPVDVRADGEDRDQDRHRDPRPLALVEALEHEVVDRADQGDVAEEQEHEAADRRQGERRQVRDRADDLAVVADPDGPARPGRDQVPARGRRSPSTRRSSRRSGRRR